MKYSCSEILVKCQNAFLKLNVIIICLFFNVSICIGIRIFTDYNLYNNYAIILLQQTVISSVSQVNHESRIER